MKADLLDTWVTGPARAEREAAFTRAELVVVLAIVALIGTVCVSARAGGRDQGLVARCAGNLRQFALALQLYGNENSDKLPNNQNTGSWAWDMSWSAGTTLLQYIPPRGSGSYPVTWRTFYCPGTSWRFTDPDNYRLWYYAYGSYREIGYIATFSGTASLAMSNQNVTLAPQPIQVGISPPTYLPAPSASQRVLVADATITTPGQNDPGLKATYNWSSVRGGYIVPFTSPHLAGSLPAGGNVAMLDGHVEWRTSSQIVPRTAGGVPVFWW